MCNELKKYGPYRLMKDSAGSYWVEGNNLPVTNLHWKSSDAIKAAVANIKMAQNLETKPSWYIDWEQLTHSLEL